MRPHQNQYDKIRVLGKGSFGTASVHRRRADSSLVVLKEINLQRLKGEQDVINEARIMSNLSHTNIIRYFSAYTTESHLIIEMEYASKGTLAAYLACQVQPLDEQDVLVIFRQIVSGLNYLHTMKIMHLDLKMTNIFVTNEGRVKIGDFGLAQYLSRTPGQEDKQSDGSEQHEESPRQQQQVRGKRQQRARRLTSSTHLLGTLAYSSPERCSGQPADFKSDIWSLGCILYELITSKPLFSSQSLSELVLSITRIQYQAIKRPLTSAIREMFESTIVREPERRPDSGELLTMTDQILSRVQLRHQMRLAGGGSHKRPNTNNRHDLSTEMANIAFASGPSEPSQINYLHSLVYQVRLDSRNIQVDRVNLPQSKRIKEIKKGRSHYLVLTYDNIVYGWGTKNCGQLGACGLSSSSAGRALRGTRSARSSMSGRRSEQAKEPTFMSAASSPASSNQNLSSSSTNLPSRSTLLNVGGDIGKAAANHQPQAALSRELVMDMLKQSQPTSRPFIVNELNRWKITQVAAGNDFSVFLSKTGIVLTCGDGSTGCLGRGNQNSTYTPSMVESLLNADVVSIACGPEHVVAVCGDGRVFTWGKNRHGRLGFGSDETGTSKSPAETLQRQQHNPPVKYISTPQLVQFPADVFIKSAYCGDSCTVFVGSDNRCWACGDNRFNRLGLDVKRLFRNSVPVTESWLPREIVALSKHKIVSCQLGQNHSTFLTGTGKLLVYGQDIDYDYRLRNNIVCDRDSHRRISQELQTAATSRLRSSLRTPPIDRPRKELTIHPSDHIGSVQTSKDATLGNSPSELNAFRNQQSIGWATSSKDSLAKASQSLSSSIQSNLTSAKLLFSSNKLQRQQLLHYAKKSRADKKMPFECVISSSCTPKFTLALTNDNRVYFWGTRSYKKDASGSCPPTYITRRSVEPQLVAACSDECFIKIGPTNHSLMSNIQTLGSDQPIIHAQDPKLVARSLADLWILDYRPTESRCCSSSQDSLISCVSSCEDCKDTAAHEETVASDSDLECCLQDNLDNYMKHDAILDPQPIISLYVPSMFRGSSLHLVDLFCFDEDRFYLVLETTIILPQQPSSRPTSVGATLLDQSHQQNQHQSGSPRQRLNSVHVPKGGQKRQVEQSAKLTGSQRSLDQLQDLRRSCPKLTALGEQAPTARPRAILEVSDVGSKVAVDQVDHQHEQQQVEALPQQIKSYNSDEVVNNNTSTDNNNDQSDLRIGASNINYSGSNTDATLVSSSQGADVSLDEPRSLSTFAATSMAGNHIITMGPQMRQLLSGREQSLQPLNFDNEPRYVSTRKISQSNGRQLARAHSDRLSPVASSVLRRQRRRRRNRNSINKSESTTTNTCIEFDETSSMPSWVRNEYMEQQRDEFQLSPPRDIDDAGQVAMFNVDSSTSEPENSTDHDDSDNTNAATCVSEISVSNSVGNQTLLEVGVGIPGDVGRVFARRGSSSGSVAPPTPEVSTGSPSEFECSNSSVSAASRQYKPTSNGISPKPHLVVSRSQPDMLLVVDNQSIDEHEAHLASIETSQLDCLAAAMNDQVHLRRICEDNLLGLSSRSDRNDHLMLANSQPSIVQLETGGSTSPRDNSPAQRRAQHSRDIMMVTIADQVRADRLSKSSTQLDSMSPQHRRRLVRNLSSTSAAASTQSISLGSALRKSLVKLFC